MRSAKSSRITMAGPRQRGTSRMEHCSSRRAQEVTHRRHSLDATDSELGDHQRGACDADCAAALAAVATPASSVEGRR